MKKMTSEVIASMQKAVDKYGDLPFEVDLPMLSNSSWMLGVAVNRQGEKSITMEVHPNIGGMVDAILNGGDLPNPPCKDCDQNDCPAHPTKKH